MPPYRAITRSWASLPGSTAPPDLGNPQLHAVVFKQRERQAELVSVEGPLRLADHDSFKAALGVS